MMVSLAKRMMQLWLHLFFTSVLSSTAISATLELSTLEWPPFSGTELPQKGIVTQIVKQAITYDNHQLKVTFVSWNRAIRMVEIGTKVGYFPEYLNLRDDYIFSNSLGQSPIVFLERKNSPIVWDLVTDLNDYQLGVVKGYVNTPEIDAMIKDGSQKFEEAMNESQNILKLAAGRIDTIIIDVHVYQYLKRDPRIAKISHLLQINRKVLDTKSLHVALVNNPEGEKWLKIINQGLLKFDPQMLIDAYLNEIK